MPARTGKTGEAVSELTKFGWMIILTGKGNHSNVYLTQSTTHNYEQLYWLDVFGPVDTSDGDQKIVYTEFQEQLQRSTQCLPLGFHGKKTTLACATTRMEALPIYLTYCRSWTLQGVWWQDKRTTYWKDCPGSTCNYNVERFIHSTKGCNEKINRND